MADKTRKNPFIWIILGLCCIGLLGFGAGGLGGNTRSLGTVGDKEVMINDYRDALNTQIRAYEGEVNRRITMQEARERGLDQAALSILVLQRTLDNEAAELGISVGDERVRDAVTARPAFANLSGEFDREVYRDRLQRRGQSEAEFETAIRDETARNLLQAAVVGGVPAPSPLVDAIVQFDAETRDVTFANVSADDLTAPLPGPTDEDLQAFYEANPALFTAPEARDISYAWVTPEMIQDQVNVADDAVRALYDDRIATFVSPERRLVERLIFADAAAANAAIAQIDVDALSFDALVADRGLALSDVDMGDVSEDQLGAAGEAVFAASPGDVVGPFETDFGPALFRMNAVLAAQEITFEEAATDLRLELGAAQARQVIAASAETINDLLAGGATLEDLAERTDLTLGQIAWTPGSTDGPAAYDSFRAAAASAEQGAFPSLEELEDGGLFVLRLDGVAPPALRPFAEVREDVARAWSAETARKAVMALAEDFASQISPLTGFDTLGLTPVEADQLTRRTFTEDTPETFLAAVYDMEVGEVRVLENGDRALILRLDRTTPPDTTNAATAAQIDAFGQQMAQGIARDMFAAFAESLRVRTDVQINQATVDAVNAQLQ